VLDAKTGEFISASPLVPGINWTTGIDPKTGVPQINPEARYEKTNKGFVAIPGVFGSHSWHAMSYSPATGLVYVPVMLNNGMLIAGRTGDTPLERGLSINAREAAAYSSQLNVAALAGGYLLAWDPARRKEAWRVPFTTGRGGGTLTTAGNLVFQGNTYAEEFAAYRADTGERVWSMPAHTGVVAAPVTYEVDGEQYVAVTAGQRSGGNYYSDNGSRILVFRLGGTAALPPKPEPVPMVLNPPAPFGAAEEIRAGEDSYDRHCASCHGKEGQSRALFPDLRYSATLHTAELFNGVVLGGSRAANGMASFRKALTPQQAEGIRAYLVARAIAAKTGSGKAN
jgi:alcohol dehydrogenase (cytochrome c)/quinohemoprotein ethanol dehydrogenase